MLLTCGRFNGYRLKNQRNENTYIYHETIRITTLISKAWNYGRSHMTRAVYITDRPPES
jgi:hypothetical protein